jgi:hypothetical protein
MVAQQLARVSVSKAAQGVMQVLVVVCSGECLCVEQGRVVGLPPPPTHMPHNHMVLQGSVGATSGMSGGALIACRVKQGCAGTVLAGAWGTVLCAECCSVCEFLGLLFVAVV